MVWTRLCAAQLMSCDVIMPDEPSGHRTSHAIAFLDNLRTHIIDFEDRRLKASENAKGNTLTMFAEKYLVKKGVFRAEQCDDEIRLPGARSCRGQTHDCEREPHFVCGGHWRELVGMHLPTSGSIRKTAGPHFAHALHHLELHMQETPTLYILWHFAGNDDKEAIVFMSDDLSVDEEFVRSGEAGASLMRSAACVPALTRRVRSRKDF